MSDCDKRDFNTEVSENGNQFSPEERLYKAIFGERNPDWVGTAFPDFKKFLRYQKALEVFKTLFRNSDETKIDLYEPEPFINYCGGSVTVFEDSNGCSAVVFKNRKQISDFSLLLKMADSFDIESGKTRTNVRYLKFDWFINDPFLGNPEVSE